MADAFLRLSADDQREVLEIVRERTQRPTLLLEKDVWVVWALNALFNSILAGDLTFKGGTSLSKAYKVIDRFSEDIDLTLDIRKLLPDLTGGAGFLPPSRSQASKWTRAVRARLPGWLATAVLPVLEAALARDQLHATLEIGGEDKDKLLLHYPAVKPSSGYVRTVVTLEFGGRATGEPHQALPVTCDMAGYVQGILFPTATPVVMSVARTFWEKATAAHVYCAQGRIRGERYARHWHDLAAIARSGHFADALSNRQVAMAVAEHKSFFFPEKDAEGGTLDYRTTVSGGICIVPEGAAREALREDYAAMIGDAMMLGDPLDFDQLMHACAEIQHQANKLATIG
ncbi:nucleotidyl transferase AbiEii/AbiGii toxin family protein [Cupriavidus lacunae]|uniref:Nucleotidyl transferase AbiEii/AbiGii toxin family protein n=1 Tax=Cupriavidus lacunae TaxID=2666307 RepID=A0A370NT26_9BURK|nr:nucleotidyl transferase AbiEii/AbiGii toxin family protein [Cupriavidus lacunae]RDK08769.1 nucleotidyl transferase AbiEii/AbiGii toxin family protein [Cupriavidus lacunae]